MSLGRITSQQNGARLGEIGGGGFDLFPAFRKRFKICIARASKGAENGVLVCGAMDPGCNTDVRERMGRGNILPIPKNCEHSRRGAAGYSVILDNELPVVP